MSVLRCIDLSFDQLFNLEWLRRRHEFVDKLR